MPQWEKQLGFMTGEEGTNLEVVRHKNEGKTMLSALVFILGVMGEQGNPALVIVVNVSDCTAEI